MFKRLEEIAKKASGRVLAVCVDEKITNVLERNKKIDLCTISSTVSSSGILKKNSRKKLFDRKKKVSVKKIKKYVKKNSVDLVICNMDEMFKYYKSFIKDTIRFSNNTIYVYVTEDIDKDFLISRYKRYNVAIKEYNYKNGYMLEIDCKQAKTNIFKNILYYFADTIYDICEFIGNILVS